MRPALVVLIVSLLLVVSLSTAPAASAHTDLVSSSPAAGATVAAAPTQVSLEFSEAVAGEFADLVLVVGGAPPQRLEVAGSAEAGPTVVGSVPSGVVPGAPQDRTVTWRVDYRVTSADGHPIQGTVSFAVSPQPTPSAVASRTPSPRASSPPSTPGSGPTSPVSSDDPPAATSDAVAPAGGSDLGGGTALALGVTSLLVLLALVAFIGVGMRRRGSEDPS